MNPLKVSENKKSSEVCKGIQRRNASFKCVNGELLFEFTNKNTTDSMTQQNSSQ